jgi:6-phosphogluconolactonase (cycloisomerase 2 family)
MKLSWFGRLALALFASLTLGLGMTACGGGTIAYIWVLGQQYNNIAAFKVDDFTGNLTQAPHEPFGTQGTMPVMLVVKPGGRYVYVLNQGTNDTSTSNDGTDGVAEFTVGGDGSLTYEQTYHSTGFMPLWMQLDNSGSYLYVLDKYSYTDDGRGSISAFAIDPTTGRLTLQTNNQSIPPGGTAPLSWEVGVDPLMMKTANGCLYTVNSADQSITPYSIGGNGQLGTVTTGNISTQAANITSINGNGSYVILTDAGKPTEGGQPGQIIPYTTGSGNCALNILNGGITPNLAGTSNPTNSLVSSGGSNTYLYVLNQSTTSTDPTKQYSSISGFLIDPTHGLTPVQGNTIFTVDSGPVCMIEDPTNKYMYVSAHNAGSVTGKLFDSTTGELSDLKRGSTFSAVGLASCLAVSPDVD